MAVQWRYRGRNISDEEIAFLRRYIAEHPALSRWALSRQLCEVWQWKQANGVLCDALCRGLLLLLERGGAIELPAVRGHFPKRLQQRPEPLVPDNRPVRGPLCELGVLEFSKCAAHHKNHCSTVCWSSITISDISNRSANT